MRILIVAFALLTAPFMAAAQSSCEGIPQPETFCPEGYFWMCAASGDRWACFRETPDGGLVEWTAEEAPVQEERPAPSEPETAVTTSDTPAAEEAPATAEPTASTTAEVAPTSADATSTETPAESETIVPITAPLDSDTGMPAAAIVEPVSTSRFSWPPTPTVAAVLGAVSAILSLLGVQAMGRTVSERIRKKCPACGRMLEEGSSHAQCGECEGTGKVEKELTATVKCSHCDGEGEDPCHTCAGTGKKGTPEQLKDEDIRAGLPSCEICNGTGAQQLDANGNPPACCECDGRGSVELTKAVQAACGQCGGSGQVE
jgi:hypothetical protein